MMKMFVQVLSTLENYKNSKLFFEKKIRFAKMFHEMDRSQKIRKIIGINEINYKCN